MLILQSAEESWLHRGQQPAAGKPSNREGVADWSATFFAAFCWLIGVFRGNVFKVPKVERYSNTDADRVSPENCKKKEDHCLQLECVIHITLWQQTGHSPINRTTLSSILDKQKHKYRNIWDSFNYTRALIAPPKQVCKLQHTECDRFIYIYIYCVPQHFFPSSSQRDPLNAILKKYISRTGSVTGLNRRDPFGFGLHRIESVDGSWWVSVCVCFAIIFIMIISLRIE